VLVSFSFLLSVFFQKTRTATVVGYIIVFLTGFLAQFLVASYLNDPATPKGLISFIMCVPQFSLYRGLFELRKGVTNGNSGMKWSDLQNVMTLLDIRSFKTYR
jgi:hypothetical protein